MKATWEIRCYDGLQELLRVEGSYHEEDVLSILRHLACRHLTDREIIEQTASNGEALQVRSMGPGSWASGSNPHYTAVKRGE